MAFSKIFVYVLLSYMSLNIFSTVDCGHSLLLDKIKVRSLSSSETEADKHNTALKRFAAISEENAKEEQNGVNSIKGSRKIKRDVEESSKLKASYDRVLPSKLKWTFENFEPGLDVPFYNVDKRKVDTNVTNNTSKRNGTDTNSNSTASFFKTEKSVLNSEKKRKSSNAKVVKSKEQVPAPSKGHLKSHHHKHKRPKSIHIEESMMKITSTEQTVNFQKEKLIPFIHDILPALKPENSISVPFLDIDKSKEKQSIQNTISNSKDDTDTGKPASSSPSSLDTIMFPSNNKEVILEATPQKTSVQESLLHQDIEELDIKNYLSNFRTGRKAEKSASKTVLPKSDDDEEEEEDSEPVLYVGTLAVDAENRNASTACITNAEIASNVFGTDSKEDKQEWVRSNKNKICNYRKFQNCYEAENTESTTSGDADGDSGDSEQSVKTYCDCFTGLVLHHDTCYIPPGIGDDSRCGDPLTFPAGSVPPGATLTPQCVPKSSCVQKPDFLGYRCVCDPNEKMNSAAHTCGKSEAVIFHTFSYLLLITCALVSYFYNDISM